MEESCVHIHRFRVDKELVNEYERRSNGDHHIYNLLLPALGSARSKKRL